MKIAALCTLLAMLALAPSCATQTAQPAPPDPILNLPEIQTRLASNDFATRQAAQADLAKISPKHLDTLRNAFQLTPDPEVKARLSLRIEEMVLYNLLHPPPLSIDVTDATPSEAAAALNKQLGSDFVKAARKTINTAVRQTSSNRTRSAGTQPRPVLSFYEPGSYTVKAGNLPFWEIIRQLDLQYPMSFSTIAVPNSPESATALQISTIDVFPKNFEVVDTFATMIQIAGKPATEQWTLIVIAYADPRVRIARVSPLKLDSITDQNGRNLLPLLLPTPHNNTTSDGQATLSFRTNTSFAPNPGISRLAHVRGTVALSIVETEKTVAFDLTDADLTPVETPAGQITVEKHPTRGTTIRMPAARQNASLIIRPVRMQVRTGGDTSMITLAPGSLASVSAIGPLSDAQFIWPDKTHEISLPIEFRNVRFPADLLPR